MKTTLAYFSLLLLLVVLVGCTTGTDSSTYASGAVNNASASDLTIYPSAKEAQPLQVGSALPNFSVQSVDGSAVDFNKGEREKPALLVTFRGGWCPYCNTHLKELRETVPELSKLGMDVYFLSGDRPDVLYSGLKGDTESVIKDSNFTILSDANAEAASALGIAFKLPEKQQQRMIDSPRLDAAGSSIANHGTLAIPSVFIVGTDGMIDFVYSNPDYKVRISEKELMDAAMATLQK